MKEYAYNYWDTTPTSANQCEASFFMPNGMFIPMKVSKYDVLAKIKKALWEKAHADGIAMNLDSPHNYMFTTIGPHQGSLDESKCLADLKPVFCMFRLVQLVSERMNMLNQRHIQFLVPSHQRIQKMDRPEIKEFLQTTKYEVNQIVKKRALMSTIDKILDQFPPKVVTSPEIPKTLKKRLYNEYQIKIFANIGHHLGTKTCIAIDCRQTAADLLKTLLEKLKHARVIHDNHPQMVLKFCGLNEFLCGNYSLIQFAHIQECLANGVYPEVWLQNIDEVPIKEPPNYSALTLQNKPAYKPRTMNAKSMVSSIVKRPFQVQIHCLENLDLLSKTELCVQLGLYHGGTSLCQIRTINVKNTGNQECKVENELVTFDIDVCNLPRMTRLCVAICEKKDETTLGWFNTMVYDYQNTLKSRKRLKCNTWPNLGNTNKKLNPLGTVEANFSDNWLGFEMSFVTYREGYTFVFPEIDNMIENARQSKALDRDCGGKSRRSITELLQPYLSSDQRNHINEQDRNEIWNNRNKCKAVPESLPCLLSCIEWNNPLEVGELYRLAQQWPSLPIDKALQLLDYKNADGYIRSIAVKNLRDIDDGELMLYLLQLLQAIKHESYVKNDLALFLIERALNNQRIGHFLFWHLRSELYLPCSQIRFCLILQAFLEGSTQLTSLVKQLECMDQFRQASEMLRKSTMTRDKATFELRNFFKSNLVYNSLTEFISPLDPSCFCKAIKPEKSRVMDSKMRPILVVAENMCPMGKEIVMIFKQGDDLRQDMLILQMIKIFDTVWKEHGYDFRMNPYGCISIDQKMGLIQVVTEANTIANIQKTYLSAARSAFDKTSLLKWLRAKNPNKGALARAITEFTYSCAGYCVATYVLGVADRHSDNIMLRENGQLFHIDYGHILGNFKEKFGICRERVPFVLTSDFVHVITNEETKNCVAFSQFQTMCEEAFMILRKHGGLILSLFTMMISTGLPELASENDLQYLHGTLNLEKSDEEALKHFKNKFDEAFRNSWTTSLNWFTHNVAKNNT